MNALLYDQMLFCLPTYGTAYQREEGSPRAKERERESVEKGRA